MRYRMAGAAMTGLGGNSAPELIPGGGSGDKKRDALIRQCSKECYELFFKGHKERGIDLDGVDAGLHLDAVRIGVEPGYMYWPLKIIEIDPVKERSMLMSGYAWGPWGTGLRTKKKFYLEYKKKGKFVRFIDKWHPKLYAQNA